MHRTYMDPSTERRSLDNAHVRAWKLWWCLEGKHFDNGRRHPDFQLQNPPGNAQCANLDKRVIDSWLSKPPTTPGVSIALNVVAGIIFLAIAACFVIG